MNTIKARLFAAVTSIILTAGVITSALAVPATSPQVNPVISDIVRFCSIAYSKFPTDGGAYLREGMNKLDKNGQNVVALACVAYGEGFQDGRETRRYIS